MNTAMQNFYEDFCPYGYLDIERAVNLTTEMGFTSKDLVSWINDWVDGTGCNVGDVDVVYMAYKKLWDIAEDEMFSNIIIIDGEELNEPGENILENYVEISPNFMCTSMYIRDGKEEAFIKIAHEYIKENGHDMPKFMYVFFDEIDMSIDDVLGNLEEPY